MNKVDKLEELCGKLFSKVANLEEELAGHDSRITTLEEGGRGIQGASGEALNLDDMIDAFENKKGKMKMIADQDKKPLAKGAKGKGKEVISYLTYTNNNKCYGYDDILEELLTTTDDFDHDFPATQQHPEALVSILRKMIHLNNRESTQTSIKNGLSKKRRQYWEGV